MNASELLRRGADIMENHGIVRGDFHKAGKGYCVQGAMISALGYSDRLIIEYGFFADQEAVKTPEYNEAMETLRKLLLPAVKAKAIISIIKLDDPRHVVATWNNNVASGTEEAVAKMREAAKMLETV